MISAPSAAVLSTWEQLKAKIIQAIKKDEEPGVFDALLVDVNNFMAELTRTR